GSMLSVPDRCTIGITQNGNLPWMLIVIPKQDLEHFGTFFEANRFKQRRGRNSRRRKIWDEDLSDVRLFQNRACLESPSQLPPVLRSGIQNDLEDVEIAGAYDLRNDFGGLFQIGASGKQEFHHLNTVRPGSGSINRTPLVFVEHQVHLRCRVAE